jgi:hypothetical protein
MIRKRFYACRLLMLGISVTLVFTAFAPAQVALTQLSQDTFTDGEPA